MPDAAAYEKAFAALHAWYDAHRPSSGAEPDRYVICAGLAVLERMAATFPLEREDYITAKNQVKTGGPLIKAILARYGEERSYAKEGARTTRGTVPAAEAFVVRLNSIKEFHALPESARQDLVAEMQGWLAEKAKEYFNRKMVEVEIRLDKPGPQIIGDILAKAAARNQAGPVAQHLVGAKLAIRYPKLTIDNYSYTTADVQTGRGGDFRVGDTVFHITVAAMPAVIDKCAANLQSGFRTILLVLDRQLLAARQMAENAGLQDRIGVQPIETFVGQNIEEISEFGQRSLASEFRRLLDTYNNRVAAIETDRSLQIVIPENL